MARPTLVCAACKRLKLKCDRREPCEMCTKHKRLHECTYSQPLRERSDNKSLHLRLLDLEEWRASTEADSVSWIFPAKVFAQPVQRRTLLQSFSTNSTTIIDDILALALEVLHINLYQFTNYNAARIHGEVTKFVDMTAGTSPVPLVHFYDQFGHRPCVTDYLINLLPSRKVRSEYKLALRNVLWLHPLGHLDNLFDCIEMLQDFPSAGLLTGRDNLAAYARAAATWALASLSYAAAATPSSSNRTTATATATSTSPIHQNLPESAVLYAAARTALSIAEQASPTQLGNTDVCYTAIMMMIYLTHASSLTGTHIPTSGLPPNDSIQLEVRHVLSFIQRFWKSAGWFADPADGPMVDPNRSTSHWEKEERRRLSSAILYYEEQFSARLLQTSEIHISNVSFRSPADIDERKYNSLSNSFPTGPCSVLHRTTYMVQRNELVKLVKTSDEVLHEAWKADVRLALARQEHQKEKAKEAGEDDACPAVPPVISIPLTMTLDAALNSSRELNDFVHTLPNPLQNPEVAKIDSPHERRILQLMHNDLVETAALAILSNWVLFLRKAALPTSPALNSKYDSATVPMPESAATAATSDQPLQLKQVGRVCIEAAGQLLRTLQEQVTLFKEDAGLSIYMYSPMTARRCFAAGVVLSRVAAICDEGDVKACREGLVLAEDLMRDMEQWLIAHSGRDAEGSTGGSKGGSPRVVLSLLRAAVDFQTGNHHHDAKLRIGVKRSHSDMLLDGAPGSVNLKSLETLPVPFTDGKFYFCKLDGPMRALAQTAPQLLSVTESSTEVDSNPSGSSRPSTGERVKKIKFTRRTHKTKSPLKVETSTSVSPTGMTPDRMTPHRRKEPPRLQPAVPIQPCPPSHTPISSAPSSATNRRFPNSSSTALQSTATTTDAPPAPEQAQASASGPKPVPTPSIQSFGTHPLPTQIHETNDVAQFDPPPTVTPIIRRPHPVQPQPRIWHPPAAVAMQYPPPPPPPPQMASFDYMSDVAMSGVPQYEAVQTIPYSSYNDPPQSSQVQSIPMGQMNQDAPISWTIPANLPPPQPPPSAFAQQSGHSNPVASYGQNALPPPTPSTYQHLPGAYPQMTDPSTQSVPGTDQQLYDVPSVNGSYYLNRYSFQYQ